MYTTGEPFYVQGTPNGFCELSVSFIAIWFMNLLFVLAGMNTLYSLKKRTTKEYIKERTMKLLVPFIFGVILTVPIQTYFAERFHNGYTGGFFEQYIIFFTKATDLTGYYGGFTPAHLWFLLFLFIISLLSLPIILYVKKNGRESSKKTPSVLKLVPLFILVYIFSVIEIGESLGQYMTYFIIGFIVLSKEDILEKLEESKVVLGIFALILCVASVTLNYFIPWENQFSPIVLTLSALRHLASWITILALIGIGRRYLNASNKWTVYMAKSSFPIYFVHQTLLVTIGYYVVSSISNTILQIVITIIGSFVSSILVCEVIKKNSVTRFMFGIGRNLIQQSKPSSRDERGI
jgi:peptidoglycan/LPS O-acetylase OafA/YrhL